MGWINGKYVLDHDGIASVMTKDMAKRFVLADIKRAKLARKSIAERAGEVVANPKKAVQRAQDVLGKPVRKFAEGYYREKAKK